MREADLALCEPKNKTAEVGSAWQDFNDLYRDDVNSFKDLTRYSAPFWLLKKWYTTYKKTNMGYWDPTPIYNESRRNMARGKKALDNIRKAAAGARSQIAGMRGGKRGVGQNPEGHVTYTGRVIKRKFKKHKGRVKKLEDKVKKLKHALPKFATHTLYKLSNGRVTTAINMQGSVGVLLMNWTSLNGLMNSLPYLAYTAPQTKANTDLVAPGASVIAHDMNFKINCWSELELRNNVTYAIDAWIYLLKPKNNISTTPESEFTDANLVINQQTAAATAGLATQPKWRPSHYPNFTRNWDILETYKQHMTPGQEFKLYNSKKVNWNPKEWAQEGTSLVNTPDNTLYWLVLIQGTICHDSTDASQIGFTSGQLDYVLYQKYSVVYENDFPTKTFDYSQSLGTIASIIQSVKDLN